MKTLLFSDPRVEAFIKAQCGVTRWATAPGTIGIEEDGEILAGFAATDCLPGIDIVCNIAGLKGRYWATRRFFQVIFRYLFVQLNLRRATALVEADNRASRSLVERLGFKQEGILRERGRTGGDVIVFAMLRRECRWIEKELNS